MNIELYTDGACSGNPGPGGWGAIMLAKSGEKILKETEIHGGAPETTNNRMEMTAVIEGLKLLKRPTTITVYTDSQYVLKGITEWLKGWKAKGWKTANKKPVKNADLWQDLDALCTQHQVAWQWVKGHAGHPLNERADALARQGTQENR
jgi:ribonuclease HI